MSDEKERLHMLQACRISKIDLDVLVLLSATGPTYY